MANHVAHLPVASVASNRRLVLGTAFILMIAVAWGTLHVVAVMSAVEGHGSGLAITFAVSYLLLWWIPLSWMERPFVATVKEMEQLDLLQVAVQVPVYNEDPTTLREALFSLLSQTRLPNTIHVVDDGSTNSDYAEVREVFAERCTALGVSQTWRRTINRGKRYAQVEALQGDDSDIWVTLDSDSTLDAEALAEGLKPFTDASITSVAGMVVVWNSRRNWLTRLTCVLYTPFTRGFRSAQSKLGRVLVNSGTLAYYRAEAIRPYLNAYVNEEFRGRPMQMNDDSMLTFYGLLSGRTVHQPSAVAFTIVPEHFTHYIKQQLRWMRGTFVRQAWWFRYLPVNDVAWWMPVLELIQLFTGILVVPVIFFTLPSSASRLRLLIFALVIGVSLNYLVALRYFLIRRSDESALLQLSTFLLAPIAGLWRIVILRPLIIYAMCTFWRVDSWGTRERVEVEGITDESSVIDLRDIDLRPTARESQQSGEMS